jgi:hypothetical protein
MWIPVENTHDAPEYAGVLKISLISHEKNYAGGSPLSECADFAAIVPHAIK